MAFFLAAYNGNGTCRKDLEYYYSKAASFFAAIVALVPTSPKVIYGDSTPGYIIRFFGDHHGTIHNIAAISLFLVLILMVTHFARRAYFKKEINRSRIYNLIIFMMVVGMISIAIIGLSTNWPNWIYWLEFVGLWLFGIGWFVAGSYETKSTLPPSGATLIHSMKVYAANKNNFLDAQLKDNCKYYFSASGCWKDAKLATTVTGWGPKWHWLTEKNRLVDQPIFMLCGSRGNDIELFPIGHESTWTSPKNLSSLPVGEQKLSFWANDYKNRYGNNSGYIKLKIYEC